MICEFFFINIHSVEHYIVLNKPRLFIPFPIEIHLGDIQYFATTNTLSISILGFISSCTYQRVSPGHIPRNGISILLQRDIFTSSIYCLIFSKMFAPALILPIKV